MKRSRSRIIAAAAFVGIFPALLVAALLAFEFSIPIDVFRSRVAATLSGALGCPLSIGGPVHLLTGTTPGIEGRDVRLDECRTIRVARASASMVRVRVDLWGLFSREIRLVEIAGERLEAEIPSAAPTPAATAADGSSRWTFREIARLHVAPAQLLVRSTDAPPRRVDLTSVEGSARTGEPMRLTLRGAERGEVWEATLVTASLGDALAGPARWPVDLAATFAGTSGSLRGTLTPEPLGLEAHVKIGSAAAERIFAALGTESPPLGALEVAGKLAAGPGRISLDSMQVIGPSATITGEARMVVRDGRPTLDVTVSAKELDYAALERWRAAGRGGGTIEEIVARELERLRGFDGTLTASIGTVRNAPVTATDAHFQAHVEAGHLKVTNRATVDGTPGAISLQVDARGPYAVDAHVSVESIPRAAVAQSRDVAQLDPRIGGLSATLTARGATVRALLEDLHGQVTGKGIQLVLPLAGERHDVRLRDLALKMGGGQAIRASARGTFAGEAIELELVGDSVVDFFRDEEWSIERLRARIGAARFEAAGVIERPRSAGAVRLSVDFAIPRLDQLAPLVGAASLPRVASALKGSIDAAADAWRIDATTFAIGATRGKGSAARKRGAPIAVNLDLERIAGDELALVGGSPRQAAASKPMPSFPDLDLVLKARRADYGGIELRSVGVDARVRDNEARAPFSLEWAGTTVGGTLEARLATGALRIGADATARGIDVARLPGPIAKHGLTGTIERLAARVEASGASPDALPANAAISIDVTDARLALPKSDALPDGARLAFGGEVRAPAAAPIDIAIKGTFRDKPFKASGRLPPIAALYPAAKPHPVQLALDYDQTHLEAAGNATLDGAAPRFDGTLDLAGDTLHTLADLAGFSAHGFGPYKISTSVEADASRVVARDLAVRLGKSRFQGSVAADTGKDRPGIAAQVRGLPVHLEDIGAQAWSAKSVEKQAAEERARGGAIDEAALERKARLLASVLRSFDADVDIGFDEVSSAGEAVGRAEMKAKLADGRLTIDPFSMWIDQGRISAEVRVDVRSDVPRYEVKFEGTGFEYGPIVRAVNPKSAVEGLVDLSLDLASAGAPEALLRKATGTFDVLILPKGQQAGRLDTLGAGIVRLVMGTLDPRSESQLNCIVGSFDIAGGLARSRVVLLDTTRARVVGELDVDLRTHALTGRLAPRSKRPELFAVVPGLQISGTIDDPSVGVSATQVVTGVLRVWQYPIAFVSDWVVGANIPADGIPDCRAAYRHVLH